MKKILLLGTMMVMGTTVFAFGGGGSSRKSSLFTSGVDAIGVHIGGDCPYGEEMIDGKCYQKCEEGVTRDRFNNCVVCTNPNEMYLPYYKGGCFEVDTTSLQCRSNMDCEANEFCSITAYVDGKIPRVSACSPLYEPQIDMQVLNVSGVGSKHMIRGPAMAWGQAWNWCLAQGARMVSLTDFGITDCSPDTKDLEGCRRAASEATEVGKGVGMKDSEGNWIDWMNNAGTGYYQTMVPQAVKDNWTEFAASDFPPIWMKETYNGQTMYRIGISTSVSEFFVQGRPKALGGHAVCVIDE